MGKPGPQVLTAKAVEAMRPDPDGAYLVTDLRCKGLALRVAASRQNLEPVVPHQRRRRQAPLARPL